MLIYLLNRSHTTCKWFVPKSVDALLTNCYTYSMGFKPLEIRVGSFFMLEKGKVNACRVYWSRPSAAAFFLY